jgi:hypothetical protein
MVSTSLHPPSLPLTPADVSQSIRAYQVSLVPFCDVTRPRQPAQDKPHQYPAKSRPHHRSHSLPTSAASQRNPRIPIIHSPVHTRTLTPRAIFPGCRSTKSLRLCLRTSWASGVARRRKRLAPTTRCAGNNHSPRPAQPAYHTRKHREARGHGRWNGLLSAAWAERASEACSAGACSAGAWRKGHAHTLSSEALSAARRDKISAVHTSVRIEYP